MNILESHPDLILSLAKFTAALLLGMVVSPLIKRPTLRAAFWTAMFIILPTMILVTHGRSIFNILPVPTVMPTVTVQMESTQAPASPPVSPPTPIVVAKPLAKTPPTISTVPTNIDITKTIETPSLTPPTPARKINWLTAIYFSGLIASLLPILISILRLRFAPKKSASDTAIEVWSMIRPEEAKVVPLYLTDSPAAPFTSGLIRAEVLLPESSDEWSMRRLRSTLYHESAHISRRDPLVRMFASLVRAMFWFHPLVWLAHRRLVAAQEEACDEIALAAGIPADEYAEDLLEAAKYAQGQLGHGLALARWSQLGSRIRIILQTNTKEIKQMKKKTIAIVTLGIAALCVGISSLGFNSQKPKSADQPEEKPKLSSTRKFSSTRESSRPPAAEESQPTTSKQSSQLQRWPQTSEEIANLLDDRAKVEALGFENASAMVVDWLKIDPTSAIAWLYNEEDPKYFTFSADFKAYVAIRAMKHDEAATLAWMADLPENDEKKACIPKVTEWLFSEINSQEAFDAKVATLPPAFQDVAHMEWISKGNVSQKGAQQLTMIYNRNPELIHSGPGKLAWSGLMSSYRKQGNYSDGIAWAMALPNEKDQAFHVRFVTEDWAKKDATAVAGYANSLPQGPVRDAAATGLAEALEESQPSNALAWAQSISDGNRRRKITRNVFEKWMSNNQEEAEKALQELSPLERKLIKK